MKMKKLLVTCAVMIIFSCILHAQPRPVKRMMAPPPGVTKIVAPGGVTTFPFEIISNRIIVPVVINGDTVKLILDTGKPMEGIIFFGSQKIDKLNLPFIGKAPVVSAADGSKTISDLAMGINFTLPGTEFSQQMVIVLPHDATRDNMFKGVDGIMGNSIFNHFVTSINYDRMEITLTDPDNFNYTGKGEKIPLKIGMFPEVSAEVETEQEKMIPVKMTVDTGNSQQLALNIGSADTIVLPRNHIKTYGFGVAKEVPINIGRIKVFRIGGFHFKDVVSIFNADKKNDIEVNGNLGLSILKRFNVIFDYAHKTMILEPNSKFNDPFEFDMAGFQFIGTEENLLKITHVINDSPAAEAGLKQGDLLESINGKPVKKLAKDEVNNILNQEGKKVTLGIKRDGESITERILLRRLI